MLYQLFCYFELHNVTEHVCKQSGSVLPPLRCNCEQLSTSEKKLIMVLAATVTNIAYAMMALFYSKGFVCNFIC